MRKDCLAFMHFTETLCAMPHNICHKGVVEKHKRYNSFFLTFETRIRKLLTINLTSVSLQSVYRIASLWGFGNSISTYTIRIIISASLKNDNRY